MRGASLWCICVFHVEVYVSSTLSTTPARSKSYFLHKRVRQRGRGRSAEPTAHPHPAGLAACGLGLSQATLPPAAHRSRWARARFQSPADFPALGRSASDIRSGPQPFADMDRWCRRSVLPPLDIPLRTPRFWSGVGLCKLPSYPKESGNLAKGQPAFARSLTLSALGWRICLP